MIYKVQAKFDESKAKEFFEKLTNGTIESQPPDGKEIVESMQRAYIDPSGNIVWSEMCYCDPPLAHERSTVLDQYFSELTTEPIKEYEKYEGDSFWDFLQK